MTSIPHRVFEQPWPEGEYRLFQLGFVVDDLFGAAANWARVFGIGPFHVLPRVEVPCTYRGTESAMDVQVALAQAGPVQIELIKQHDDRASVYRDLAERGPCGFHQICTVTPDYDRTRAHYEQLGYELATEVRAQQAQGQRVAYFDTFDDFGFFTEVIEQTPEFLAQLAEMARTCAEWDGTDPVRILTRDGYRTP
jgi:hypothetical protein